MKYSSILLAIASSAFSAGSSGMVERSLYGSPLSSMSGNHSVHMTVKPVFKIKEIITYIEKPVFKIKPVPYTVHKPVFVTKSVPEVVYKPTFEVQSQVYPVEKPSFQVKEHLTTVTKPAFIVEETVQTVVKPHFVVEQKQTSSSENIGSPYATTSSTNSVENSSGASTLRLRSGHFAGTSSATYGSHSSGTSGTVSSSSS